MGVDGRRERAGRTWLDALVVLAGVTAMAGAFACEGPASERSILAKDTFALTMPDYGQTITIDFKSDATGTPLSRATVLAEQYAAVGVHFQGGFILGDRAVDFPDYHTPVPDNMICAAPRADGHCAGGATLSDTVQLVVTIDFSVCAVAIAGLTNPGSLVEGDVAVAGYDAAGNLRDSWDSGLIASGPATEGKKFGWIPGHGINYPGQLPTPSLDVRRVVVSGSGGVAALDDLIITRCKEVVPRCKPALVCVPESGACVSSGPVTIDDGSYSSTGGALAVTQSPVGPFTDGPSSVTLTASDSVDLEMCTSTVRVGHCDVAQIDCPASTVVECATRTDGTSDTHNCTYYNVTAYASDGCRPANLGALSPEGFPCIPPRAPTPVAYVAQDLRGADHKCTTVVTVVDRTPPQPPGGFAEISTVDGQMHTFTIGTAKDACELDLSGPDHVAITCVTADEPSDGVLPDIEIVDASTFKVRASSDPKGDGRIYNANIIARDSVGNVSDPGYLSIGVPIAGLQQYVDSGVHQQVCRPVIWPTGGAGGAGGVTGAGGVGGQAGAGGGAMATGGAASTGGATAAGGMIGSGGGAGAGGSPSTSTGGAGVGGASGRGGRGGAAATGGAPATGGTNGSAGAIGSGGSIPATGGSTSIGGSGAVGGAATPGGGTAGTVAMGVGGHSSPKGSGGKGGQSGEGDTGGSHTGGCAVAVTSSPPSPIPIFIALGAWAVRSRRRPGRKR